MVNCSALGNIVEDKDLEAHGISFLPFMCYFCNIYDLHEIFFFCWFVLDAYFPSTVPARLVGFLNCVPFRTDIADLLGCLFIFENLIVAKMSATDHKATVSDGHNGFSTLMLTRHGSPRHIWRLRS